MDLRELSLSGYLRVGPLLGGLIFVVASLWPVLVEAGSPSVTTVVGTAVGLGPPLPPSLFNSRSIAHRRRVTPAAKRGSKSSG